MSIVHEMNIWEESINETLTLTFTSKLEEYYSWEEVTLNNCGHQIKIGTYYTDGIAGLREWLEYNERSIVFFREDKYDRTFFITKAYDISTNSFISGTQNELANYYAESFNEKAKVKSLTCMKAENVRK